LSPTKKKGGEKMNELFGTWNDNDIVSDVDDYVRELTKGGF
jgi:hypothetical protein